MKIVAAAIAAAGLVAVPAIATAATPAHEQVSVIASASEGREVVTMKISTSGLNLATPEGAMALRKRVHREIAAVCNPGDRLGADFSPDYQCRKEMARNVEPTLLAITQSALVRPAGAN